MGATQLGGYTTLMLTHAARPAHAPRMLNLIRALRDVERAELMARRLRREHGADAEAVCDLERSKSKPDGRDGPFWADVRRSLRWVKSEEGAPRRG